MENDRVLVTDDDESFLGLMLSHLRRRGHVVEGAADGHAALKILQSQGPFTVLVTDLMMPGMGGLEVLRHARKLDSDLEVIVITGAGTLDSAIAAMREDGAYDYLLKPLENMGELSLAVERAAGHRRLKKERESLQAQLAAESDRLKALIANTGDAILSANAEGVMTVANPAATRLCGTEDIAGKEALSGLPKHLATLVKNWRKVGNLQPTLVEVPCPDGTLQMVSLSPIIGTGAENAGWVMVLRDVTHLKKLDELKMQWLTEGVKNIRHPLAQAFSTLAELNEIETSVSERHTQGFYRLVKLLGRIQVWADDLMTLAAIEAGIGVVSGEMDLGKLVEEWVPSLSEELASSKNLSLRTFLEDDVPPVNADRELVRRLVTQLIEIAARSASPKGEIRVSVRNHKGQAWLEVMEVGDPDLTVMAPQAGHYLPGFAEADEEDDGLDTMIVKTIVKRLGGQVWVRKENPSTRNIAVSLPSVPRLAAPASAIEEGAELNWYTPEEGG